jgi:adenylyltransferase/sulfurtransferase
MDQNKRYRKQILVPEFGPDGQAALARSSIVLVGCGALGSAQAMLLARAGVGHLILIDRDIVEESNLHRQILFDDEDAKTSQPKAAAAARRLAACNSGVTITVQVRDLTPESADELLGGADVLIDATDNYETRFLLNDWAVQHGIPWIYGGVLATGGMSSSIIPGTTACLACIQSSAPVPGTSPTCETAGILPPVVLVIAAIQSMEAIKLAAGKHEAVLKGLLTLDLWTGEQTRIETPRNPDCPCCVHQEHPWINGQTRPQSVRLCGQDSIHITPARDAPPPDLTLLSTRLSGSGQVTLDDWCLHFVHESADFIIFRDGRILVRGTNDISAARTLIATWLGM